MVLPRLAFPDLQFSAIGGFWFWGLFVCFVCFWFLCGVFCCFVLVFVFIHLRERAWWEGAEERETPKLKEEPLQDGFHEPIGNQESAAQSNEPPRGPNSLLVPLPSAVK